jgi:hypothetical protein
MAAMEFWFALTLGSEKVPLSLFKCFRQGVGVEKDPYMRDLMYGAVLQLTPKDCADKVKPENKLIIAKSMQPEIDALVKLVKKTHSQLPAEGVDLKVFNDQITKFNHAIKLPSGKLIQNCFIEKSVIVKYTELGDKEHRDSSYNQLIISIAFPPDSMYLTINTRNYQRQKLTRGFT